MMINTNPLFQSQSSPPKPPPAKVASPSRAEQHTVHRAARRQSKRDEVIEQTKAVGRLSDESRLSADGAPSSSSFSSVSLDASVDSEAALQRQQATAAAILGTSSAADVHLKSLLQDEKIYSERLRTQALIFQNELHERDEEIAGLKKGAANLEKTVHGLQKMAEQLQHVQMQISKKLEQTLLDKVRVGLPPHIFLNFLTSQPYSLSSFLQLPPFLSLSLLLPLTPSLPLPSSLARAGGGPGA